MVLEGSPGQSVPSCVCTKCVRLGLAFHLSYDTAALASLEQSNFGTIKGVFSAIVIPCATFVSGYKHRILYGTIPVRFAIYYKVCRFARYCN